MSLNLHTAISPEEYAKVKTELKPHIEKLQKKTLFSREVKNLIKDIFTLGLHHLYVNRRLNKALQAEDLGKAVESIKGGATLNTWQIKQLMASEKINSLYLILACSTDPSTHAAGFAVPTSELATKPLDFFFKSAAEKTGINPQWRPGTLFGDLTGKDDELRADVLATKNIGIIREYFLHSNDFAVFEDLLKDDSKDLLSYLLSGNETGTFAWKACDNIVKANPADPQDLDRFLHFLSDKAVARFYRSEIEEKLFSRGVDLLKNTGDAGFLSEVYEHFSRTGFQLPLSLKNVVLEQLFSKEGIENKALDRFRNEILTKWPIDKTLQDSVLEQLFFSKEGIENKSLDRFRNEIFTKWPIDKTLPYLHSFVLSPKENADTSMLIPLLTALKNKGEDKVLANALFASVLNGNQAAIGAMKTVFGDDYSKIAGIEIDPNGVSDLFKLKSLEALKQSIIQRFLNSVSTRDPKCESKKNGLLKIATPPETFLVAYNTPEKLQHKINDLRDYSETIKFDDSLVRETGKIRL